MKLVLLLVALTAVYTANCRDQDSNIEALLFPDEPANTDITGEDQLFPNEQVDDASIGETQRVLIGQENQNIDEEVQQMKENYDMGSVSDHRSSMTKERKRCIPTISCTSAGGHCVKKSGDCNGTVDRYGCRGSKKCKCCIPDDIICIPVQTTAAPTTTRDTTTTPQTTTTTDSTTTTTGPSCDCSYTSRNGGSGCAITTPAPNNYACKCRYLGAWTCSGEVAACLNPSSKYCLVPDTSIWTCIQGKGDCAGYSEYFDDCDCEYSSGGCKVTRAAPKNKGAACRCSYRGAWTCKGYVIGCRSPNSRYCISPGLTVSSCHQGGGDCGGY